MIAVATATKPTRKQFTVEEYYKLGELGMLGDGKTELIDGDIIYMAPIGTRHDLGIKVSNNLDVVKTSHLFHFQT